MAQVLPIEDAYIDSVIISQGPFNPNMNKTQGVKMRELIKLLRDRLRQEITENLLINQVELQNKADLVNGVIPANQLPGYVDDVLEFENIELLPYPGESGKIYITTDSNQTYRWSGTIYVTIGHDIALGETPNTAYRGDRGRVAFDHSQIVTGNPHGTSKIDLGLGNVDNTSDLNKPVSTPQANAINLKLTASVATDAETQISTIVLEDNKVITRLKLFNWWNWIKLQALFLGNKLTLMSGTTTIPPLIIPNGILTTISQNGAIERDASGLLWTNRNGSRFRLLEDDGAVIPIIAKFVFRGNALPNTTNINTSQEKVLGSIPIGTMTNSFVGKITAVNQIYSVYGAGSIAPTKKKIAYYLRINNGTWRVDTYGASAPFSDKLIGELEILANNADIVSTFSFLITGTGTDDDSNGAICGIDINGIQHNLRASDNTKNLLVKNAEFQVIEKIIYEYADATNANGINRGLRTSSNLKLLYIERITK